MRILLFLLLLTNIVQAKPLGFENAQHLLLRTGFAPTLGEVLTLSKLSRSEAVNYLLNNTKTTTSVPPPTWVNEPITLPKFNKMDVVERQKLFKLLITRQTELLTWWLMEMRYTRSPLTERMTLFWHNHFAIEAKKVKLSQLLYDQNVILRKHAVGNFRDLLHEVSKDPAMLIYLDGVKNKKQAPNENFAREVMELFTLGEGHYTEKDIKEAARAFTGWSINLKTGKFMFRRFLHDSYKKTVLDTTGFLKGEDVLNILLDKPATAEHITRKLYQEFVSLQPDEKEIKRLSNIFYKNNYEIKPLLYAIFTSDAFYANENRGALIKSPVNLVIGTLRQFDLEIEDYSYLITALKAQEQLPYAPPNVKGWPGGTHWITTNTLLTRKQFLARLFRGQEMKKMMRDSFDADKWFQQFEHNKALMTKLLYPIPPVETINNNQDAISIIQDMVLDLSYQLQ